MAAPSTAHLESCKQEGQPWTSISVSVDENREGEALVKGAELQGPAPDRAARIGIIRRLAENPGPRVLRNAS
jgi:hypothetical protein